MSTNKKIFLGSSIFFLITFLFWGIYNSSFKDATTENLQEKNSSLFSSNKATDNNQKIAAITEEAVISPIILSDGVTIQYYSKDTGHSFKIDLAGNNKKTVSSTDIAGLEKIIWSPSEDKVLSKFLNNKISYFDINKKKGGTFDENVQNINFQNENKIVYSYQNSKMASLNIADFDGKNWKKLTDLEFAGQNIEVIPHTGLISFWNYPDANYETKLYTIPVIGGEKKLIFNGKFGGDFIWNDNGSYALGSFSNQKEGKEISLGIFDFKNSSYKDLAIPTFSQKCTWSKNNKTIFYALPGSIPNNSILPNSYLNNDFNTVDTFWKVDIESGEKERIVELEELQEKLDAIDLFLNNDESILFFTNRYDGKLYRINL